MLDYRLMERLAPIFLEGLEMTLIIAVVSAAGAIVWGGLLVVPRMSRSRWAVVPVTAYIELVRNSPLLVQIYLLYFGLPVTGIWIPTFWCGVIAIVAQHGAFLCEIYRGGIEAVSRSQWEAGRAIGMRNLRLLRLIILPQAALKIFPSLVNQIIILIKDTSLVSAIGIMELTLMAKLSVQRTAATFEVFTIVAALYLLITISVGFVGRVLENRLRVRT